jgi:YD repeat-containing protein
MRSRVFNTFLVIADRIIKVTNGMNGSNTQTLGYDDADRLNSVASPAETASYTYDADGNRAHQVYNGVATNFTYAPTSNRLASASGGMSASYGYNAWGSTTTINGLAAYTYDPFGRLSNAGGAGFLVSAEDQRLRKTSASGTTYFVPDAGGAMLAESLSGTWYDYVWLMAGW